MDRRCSSQRESILDMWSVGFEGVARVNRRWELIAPFLSVERGYL